MLNRVTRTPIEAVPIDAVLARPVRGSAGERLADEGEPLSRSLLTRMRERGVATVVVYDPDAVDDTGGNGVEKSLDHLFRHWHLSPAMQQLRRLLTEHRVGPR